MWAITKNSRARAIEKMYELEATDETAQRLHEEFSERWAISFRVGFWEHMTALEVSLFDNSCKSTSSYGHDDYTVVAIERFGCYPFRLKGRDMEDDYLSTWYIKEKIGDLWDLLAKDLFIFLHKVVNGCD